MFLDVVAAAAAAAFFRCRDRNGLIITSTEANIADTPARIFTILRPCSETMADRLVLLSRGL